jgi:hypothetical protein
MSYRLLTGNGLASFHNFTGLELEVSYGTLVVNSWVSIHEGCDITYSVNGSDGTHFTAGDKAHPFEFFFQAEALRQFIELGVKALAEMDALAAKEEAEWDARERTKLEQAAEHSA